MRFLVVLASMAAALTFIAASGLMNFVFMTSLGKTAFERDILGAVSVAVSAFLALLPTLMLWAWRERRVLDMLLGLPVFVAFAAFSLSSAVGFAAKNRGGVTEDRALAAARLSAVRLETAETEAKLKAFGVPSPLSALEQSLRGLEQDRRWQSTKACADATADASRAFCSNYFELKAEAARANEAGRLEERLAGLRGEARALAEQGAGREADNQTAVLAKLLGLAVVKVERGLTLFLAILVEIGAALGLYFATGHMRLSPGRRGMRVIEGEIVQDAPVSRPGRVALKRIAPPRRVPPMRHGSV
jgi:hypothetical protein